MIRVDNLLNVTLTSVSYRGIVNSFGIFQEYYESALPQSPSTISWIGTFQAFLLVALGIVVGPIFDRGHFRVLVIAGTFLTVFGLMMTSLATEYWQIFLAQGLCVGLGTACLFLPGVALTATYFTTRRALAIGVVAAGGSIGSVIFPITFYQLQPRIGFPWAVRVLAFIALATCTVSIAVMRPLHPPSGKSRAIIDHVALRSLRFWLFSIGVFFAFVGLYVPIFYIILWAERHCGIDTGLSFYLLAVLNASSVFGRIIPGQLADRYGPLLMMTVLTIVSAILAYAAIGVHTLAGCVVFAILYGFSSGAVVSLPNSVVAVLVPEIELVGTWMGMSFCFAGTGILIGSPIAGTIINVAEDRFTGGFAFSASVVMVAGVLFLVANLYHAKNAR
jgi:MFS family permease